MRGGVQEGATQRRQAADVRERSPVARPRPGIGSRNDQVGVVVCELTVEYCLPGGSGGCVPRLVAYANCSVNKYSLCPFTGCSSARDLEFTHAGGDLGSGRHWERLVVYIRADVVVGSAFTNAWMYFLARARPVAVPSGSGS